MSETPDQREILSIIETWARGADKSINRAHSQKGGWEGWAQVEIANALMDHYNSPGEKILAGSESANYEMAVDREQNVYLEDSSGQRADLVLRYFGKHPKCLPNGERKPLWTTIIELKCESYEYNTDDFSQGVRADVEKMKSTIDKRYLPDDWKNVNQWAIAITASQDRNGWLYLDDMAEAWEEEGQYGENYWVGVNRTILEFNGDHGSYSIFAFGLHHRWECDGGEDWEWGLLPSTGVHCSRCSLYDSLEVSRLGS